MPELDIQRRETTGMPWWVWLLIAVLAIGLIWWIIAATTTDRELAEVTPGVAPTVGTEPAERVAGARESTDELTSAEWLPLAAMRANPDNYFDQSVSGIGTVAEVASDRGFWIEQRGERVFVVKDEPLVETPALTAGQQISLRGTVHNPDNMQEVAGVMQLDEVTLKTLQGEPAFIKATAIEAQNETPDPVIGSELSAIVKAPISFCRRRSAL
jgi:hypothetical protein